MTNVYFSVILKSEFSELWFLSLVFFYFVNILNTKRRCVNLGLSADSTTHSAS